MGLGIELPQLITGPVEWDAIADVIVVGFGIAGACAAISAAEAGARVLLLERSGTAGGASATTAYNTAAAEGRDPEFGKHPDWLTPLTEGPWGAFDLTPGRATYVGFTLGGVCTSVDGAVLRADGSVVSGLYAAGACASNLAQDSSGYASGTCLGEGSYFGRRAGAHAAGISGAAPNRAHRAESTGMEGN